jgi:putative phosphoribosyl transferase
VIGLARGGVPIARQVAAAIGASFDVLVSRKLGVPGIEELALGAIAEGHSRVVAGSAAWYIGVPPRVVERVAAREHAELERRAHIYRDGQPLPELRGRTVILVDDGLATSVKLRAAARAIRRHRPKRLIAAVPVASASSASEVRQEVDELIAVLTPERFETPSAAYEDYSRVKDEDVLNLLGRRTDRAIANDREIFSDILRDVSDRIAPASPNGDMRHGDDEQAIEIPVCDSTIMADLGVPRHWACAVDRRVSERVRGLAILAHGWGSSRGSYRNRYIAGRLRLSGFATLRVDLRTRAEHRADEAGAPSGLNIGRIASRLTKVCEWATREGIDGAHRTILVGASTGAAAALTAAARRRGRILAVVARGGRVDLAADALPHVQAPVLLIAGAHDRDVLQQNRDAMRWLPHGSRLVRVPHAGHLFDEPGALGAVAEHVVRWLDQPRFAAPHPDWMSFE